MRRQRDTHARKRGVESGRLSAVQTIQQELALALRELDSAVNAPDLKTTREHVSLARRLLAETSKKLERLK